MTDVLPSSLVIERSASGTIVSVSVALLLPVAGSAAPAGAATLAVFTRVPVALAAAVPLSVKVALPPAGRLTVVLMLPVPLAAPQVDPAGAVQVQVTPVRAVGTVSVTGASATALGPAFATVIV